MTTHIGNRSVITHRRLVLAAWGAAFALAALTSVGGWQLGVHTHSSNAGAPAVQQVTTAAQPGAPVSAVPAASDAIVPAASRAAPVVYLVGSDEQATQVQRGLEEADGIRLPMGLPPLDVTVRQVEGDEQANAAAFAVADENRLRVTLGLPEIVVVDLRLAPSTTAAQPASTQASDTSAASSSAAAMLPSSSPRLVLVGSAEQATRTQQAIDEANVYRALFGLAPLDDAVLQVGTQMTEDTVRWAYAIENEARALQGLPKIQVVDLRPAAAPPATDAATTTAAAPPASAAAVPALAAVVRSAELPVVYLVSSEEQARFFRQAFETQAGPLPAGTRFEVVGSAEQASQVADALAVENDILTADHRPSLTIYDLRPLATPTSGD